MINRGFAIRKNVVGFLVVAGWLIGSPPASAQESGEQIFQKSCAACHSIGAGKLVGPDLAGVNDRRPEDWLLKFTKSSQTLMKSGDKTATALFEQFNKIPMPDQALSDDQIRKVLAHIKETGGSPAAGKEPAAPAPAAMESAAEPTPDEIRRGGRLFEGRVRFANAGPACNACHHVNHDAVIGGGILARDLTLVFSRMGKQGVGAMLGSVPFPVMQAAYEGKALTADEVHALIGFLQQADRGFREHAFQQPRDYGWGLFNGGVGGVVVLLGLYSLTGRRRKKRSVNQDIYDRQVKSE